MPGVEPHEATAPLSSTNDPNSANVRERVLGALATPRAAVGLTAAGVVLFVVASVASSAASTTAAHPKPTSTPAGAAVAALPSPASVSSSPVTAAPRRQLARTPVHAAKKAPSGHGAISALAANGIPRVALNAYRVAAARLDNVQPGCGIDWSLLAGIGREESDHGRFGGAVLHADGVSTPAIIGPALDGVHWDYIPAPGNGIALDGDATYAHALGPMQFIPSTWAGYGADADGDGKADIFDINDAALGAGRYLCAAGGNLRTVAGRTRAVLAYNHNDQYLAQVLALANAYKHGVTISGLPVGITTGSLPKVADTGYLPPANPGDPTAVGSSAKPKAAKSSTATTKPAPKPTTGGATSSSSSTSTAPHPAPTSSTPRSSAQTTGHSSSAPGSSGSSHSAAPTPTPTPTLPTCSPVDHLLGKC